MLGLVRCESVVDVFLRPLKLKWNDVVGLFIASISLVAPLFSRRTSVIFGPEASNDDEGFVVGPAFLLHPNKAPATIKPASVAHTLLYDFTRFILLQLPSL